MQNPKTSLRRLYFRLKHDYLSPDNIIFVVAIIMCGFWTFSSITAMSRNWELSQAIAARSRELERLKLEVETMELENAYYSSAEYAELSARSKQNKKLPGENLVYLPENSESAREKYKPSSETSAPAPPSNFSQWMSFLFGI